LALVLADHGHVSLGLLAGNIHGFYIVRGPDKKCVVIDTAPETTITRVGKNALLLKRT
jgi:hypothetical protein